MAQTKKPLNFFFSPIRWTGRRFVTYWRSGRWQKMVVGMVVLAGLALSTMYGIAVWYQHSQKSKQTELGVSFIADYATFLGLDAHQTYQAILNDLGVKHLRLVSYWSDVEPTQGTYDFSELDWEMQQAQAHGAKVSLAIGLRQPRWPECHAPSWVDVNKPVEQWQPELEAYITAVVNRYKYNPALQSFQLENEFFNSFGNCPNRDRNRLATELRLVKQIDPNHPVIISRSDNYVGFALRQPLPDEVGISVYRRVWDGQVTHRYFQYPFTSWYYAFLAGTQKILTGKDSVLHELQTEPWPPNGKGITDTSLAEQNKSFNATIFKNTVQYGKQTGLKHIYLWGAEYWYYRAQTLHDDSIWQTAKQIFHQ